MVRDRRLRPPQGLDEVAGTGLALRGARDHGQQPQPGRVGERLEGVRELAGFALAEGGVGEGSAAAVSEPRGLHRPSEHIDAGR